MAGAGRQGGVLGSSGVESTWYELKHVVVVSDNNILSCMFLLKTSNFKQAMLKKASFKSDFLFGCFFMYVQLSTG